MDTIAATPLDAEKLTELTLDALKRAIAQPGEHRLFRSGKLAGLFPSRTGTSADAALHAMTDGLLETVRTETKGRLIVEWVRITPRGVAYVYDRDSPKSVLRELREVIGTTRNGIPDWMDSARQETAALAERFERQAAEILQRLDSLTERVEAALRRAEVASPRVPEPVAESVPWSMAALEYLDRRAVAGAIGDCPLSELFHALRDEYPQLTLPEFQTGLRRLYDVRAIRLRNGGGGNPEYAMIVDAQTCDAVGR